MSTQPDFDNGPTLPDIVAANIRARAAYLGLTQVQIAEALGWSKTTVQQRWHAGSRSWKVEDLEALSPILGVEPWQLLQPDMTNGGPIGTAAVSGTSPGTRTRNPLITSLAPVIDFDEFVNRRAA